jgi:hypothetical protein
VSPAQHAERNAQDRAGYEPENDLERRGRIELLGCVDGKRGNRTENDRRNPHTRYADALRPHHAHDHQDQDDDQGEELSPRGRIRTGLHRDSLGAQ